MEDYKDPVKKSSVLMSQCPRFSFTRSAPRPVESQSGIVCDSVPYDVF